MNQRAFSPIAKASFVGFVCCFLYVAVFHPLSLLEIPKLRVQDFFFVLRRLIVPKPLILNDVVVVMVDDESVEKIRERQPFPRGVYANVIDKLMAYDPKLIGFDMIFSGRSNPSDDFLLAQSIQKSGRVVLASFVDQEKNYVWPLSELRTTAKASGVVNKLLDRDLCVRKTNLFYRDQKGDVIAWPWEIEIAASLLGFNPASHEIFSSGVRFDSANSEKDSFFIPFYDRRETMINYRFNLEDVAHIPLWRVLEDGNLKDRFYGKVILVGAVSRVLHDYYHTSFGLMPGVIVNMNLLVNLLTRDFLKKIPLVINAFFVFFFIFLASCLGLRENIVKGLLLLGFTTVVFLGGFFVLFLNNFVGDYFTSFASGWLVFIAIAFYRYFHTLLENIQLRGKVITDPLTGLYNRRVLESQINIELEKLVNAKGSRKTDPSHELSVLMVDIDDFKRINDTYGHQFGDDVLKNVGFLIKESIRKDDIAARFGGEEFCIVLPHTTKEEVCQIAEKIRKNIQAKKFSYVNQVASFTVSIGIACAREDNLLASRSLIRAADEALYEAKKQGKNRVYLYQKKSS